MFINVFYILGTNRHFIKQRILLEIALKIWRSHVNLFKCDYRILSEIGTDASENAYFLGDFSDSNSNSNVVITG